MRGHSTWSLAVQVMAAIEHLPDYPTWEEIQQLESTNHGVGEQTMMKLAELWKTGSLKRLEEFRSNPEQQARELLIKARQH